MLYMRKNTRGMHYIIELIGEKLKFEQNRQQSNVVGKIDNGDITVYNNKEIIGELCNLKSIYIFAILRSHQN